MRFLSDVSKVKSDLKLFVLIFAVQCCNPLLNWLFALSTLHLIILLLSTVSIIFVASHGGPWLSRHQSGGSESVSGANEPKSGLKPLIFPCRTTHTRMFPKNHSFSYSYLLVGIPVGWRGSAGSLLSADAESLAGSSFDSQHVTRIVRTWFGVEASDHLDRGNAHLGLLGKLHGYLMSQVCSICAFESPMSLIFK